jgi:hypothetical protein
MKFPSIADVQSYIHHLAVNVYSPHEEFSEDEGYLDVRLAIRENGNWHVFSGSSDCDQWHGWVCGSNAISLTTKPTKKEARSIAVSLLDQCREQAHA